MDKFEKETEKVLLDHEKKALDDLKATYTNALKDIKLRIRDLQADIDLLKLTEGDEDAKNKVQSKVYQLEYQKALEGQINAILEVVKQDNVKTTQTFLTKVYEDAFLGINYNLQKKGIPVIMPINNKLIVDTINIPTEDLKFNERLYKQVNELKKVVKAEISRGIATGQSYSKIAQQVSLLTEADFNKSYRIVRTEAGRVSSTAKLKAMQDAKARGCDIVKQWDATLDNSTREIHQQLDGQWVEVDEYFKASGYKTKRPHGFGIASQDINCRCVLLSVPRWDIEDVVEKYDNITGEIIKAKNYADWKEKYYSVANDYKENKTTNIKYLEDELKRIDIKLLEENKTQLEYLTNKYPKISKYVSENELVLGTGYQKDTKAWASGNFMSGYKVQKITLNYENYKTYESFINEELRDTKSGWAMPFSEDKASIYTLTHEYGHFIHNVLLKDYVDSHEEEYLKIKDSVLKSSSISASTKKISNFENNIIKNNVNEIMEIAKSIDKDVTFSRDLSRYGKTNYAEAFAEMFANSQCGKPNVLGQAMNIWLEERFK